MRRVHITEKLNEIGVNPETIILGDFDQIAELTAKRTRDPSSKYYRTSGAFFRSNYERGILVYYLIRQFGLSSLLEVGFGRGYVSLCAAKAFYDSGVNGRIVSIDPKIDRNFVSALHQIFPKYLFEQIELVESTSQDILGKIKEDFDFVYIDGDHSYESTKHDWENTKNKYNRFLLFDDYHMPSVNDPGIKCREAIDEIDDQSKELIIMDRRMFVDDLGRKDDEINYGQVLLTK